MKLPVQYFLAFLMLSFLSFTVNAQSLSWAQGFFGYTSTGPITFTKTNSSISTVHFNGTVDFDASPNTYNLTTVGNWNLGLLKQDAAGNFIWAKHFAGLSSSVTLIFARDICQDTAGNIYIIGGFQDSFDFDPGPAIYKMASIGNFSNQVGNIFVLKLTSNADFVWAKQMGGAGLNSAGGQGIKVDKAGNIYMVSNFSGSIDADPGPNVLTLNGGGTLIHKLDNNGNLIWAKQIVVGGPVWSFTTDSLSNLYFVGQFASTVDFDPGLGIANLSPAGGTDIFIEKLDSSGNFQWVKQIGGISDDIPYGISLDPFCNILVTGYFGSTVDFDPGPNVYNLTANSSRSIFTLKLRNNGNFVWATKTGASAGNYVGRAVTTDSMGNVYTAAIAPGGCDIDPGPAVKYVIGDCVVQKLDSFGNFVWGVGWEGDVPGWIGLDNVNNVYVTGSFSGFNKDFDPGLGSFLLNGNSQFSGFIEKLCVSPLPLNITVLKDTICIGDIAVLSVESIQGATYIWGKDGSPITNSNNDTLLVTQPGDYTVNVYGVGCPYDSDTVHVSVFPVITPTIQIASSPFSVPAGQQVTVHATVNATGGYPYTINWYNHGVLFATTTTDVVSYIKPIGKDSLSAVIKVNTPCTSPVSSNLIFVTGIDNNLVRDNFSITPNPASDKVYIQSQQLGNLEIIDMMGRVVFQTTVINTQASIDLSSLSEGLYHYKFMTKVGTTIKDKLVIMR